MKDVMKAISVLILVAFIAMTAVGAFAAGNSIYNTQTTLISGAVGTTKTSSAFTFDYPVNNVACDVLVTSGPTPTAMTFVLEGNQGSSASTFDAVLPYLITTQTQTTAFRTYKATVVPVRTIRATLGSTITVTSLVNVNCTGIQ